MTYLNEAEVNNFTETIYYEALMSLFKRMREQLHQVLEVPENVQDMRALGYFQGALTILNQLRHVEEYLIKQENEVVDEKEETEVESIFEPYT